MIQGNAGTIMNLFDSCIFAGICWCFIMTKQLSLVQFTKWLISSFSIERVHTKTLVNKIEMVQRRAARFCHNDYKTIEKGCVSEMIRKLNLEPLNIRRTNKLLTIFHKAINGHLALPIGHLQPVLRRTRHLNSKAYNTIHTSKDCYKYSFFPRTIKDWNSLPDKIATIKEPHKFKFALAHFD